MPQRWQSMAQLGFGTKRPLPPSSWYSPPDRAVLNQMTWGLTATVTATMGTSHYQRHTSATVHALAAAQDLAVCYT